MGKIFCIMGKSASGKDTIFARLSANNELQLKTITPYTTRPIRVNEENGRDYYFVTDDEYEKLIADNRIIESRTYQTVQGPWHYFTADDGQIDLESGSVILIGTVESFEQFCNYYGKENVVPIYIEVDDGMRLERALFRERMQMQPDYAEMCRRFLADCVDFSEENLKKAGINKRYINMDLDFCYRQICSDIRFFMREYLL